MESLKKIGISFLLVCLMFSCQEESVPKPKAYLRLAYDQSQYIKTSSDCPYTFEISNLAKANFTDKCWINIEYPNLRATLNITYRSVENNLIELLRESEKLTYNHAIRADGISSRPFEDLTEEKYGSISEVTGNAASPLQFHLTDSAKHFLTGALYFRAQPNYDSILPAVKFLEKDIKHLMETLRWAD